MRIGTQTILSFLALVLILNYSTYAGTSKDKDKSDIILSHTDFPDLDNEQQSLNHFIENLAQRKGKYKNEESFIRYVFHKTHNKYLKHYVEQAPIDQLFTKGYYDCLTGTALYLMIFEELGYRHEVTELDYHVYLTISSGQKTYIIESTDPLNGIIESGDRLHEKITPVELEKYNSFYEYKSSICNTISVEQLIGLLNFNQAVKSYNDFNFAQAWNILQTAKEHYPSERMEEFELLILKELNRSQTASIE